MKVKRGEERNLLFLNDKHIDNHINEKVSLSAMVWLFMEVSYKY